MKLQTAKREMKLQEWLEQVRTCEASGLSVSAWCEQNGLSKTTYYYRQKRVQEEVLEALETTESYQLSALRSATGNRLPVRVKQPEFAQMPVPQNKGAAVTVWIGTYAVDIQNNADAALVEHVLRVVSRI